MSETPQAIQDMVLYAWVGEDELGSGEIGLKQARCPAGLVPMVACQAGKMEQAYIIEALQQQASVFGKAIRLVKFRFEGVVQTLEPGA